MRTKLKKIIYRKFGLNDEIEKKQNFYKWAKKKKPRNKTMTELEK
jgi:hypothetical protein